MHSVTSRRSSIIVSRSTALSLILLMLGNATAFSASKPIDPAAEKAKIEARGVGQGVRVTMLDKTEVKGVIASIGEQSFVLSKQRGAQPRTIEYAQISGVHRDRLTAGQKVTIAVVVAGVAIGIVAAVIAGKVNNSKFGTL